MPAPIDEGTVRAELAKLLPIADAAKRLEAFLQRTLRMFTEEDIIWQEIDPTTDQLDTLLASYQRLKLELKTRVGDY